MLSTSERSVRSPETCALRRQSPSPHERRHCRFRADAPRSDMPADAPANEARPMHPAPTITTIGNRLPPPIHASITATAAAPPIVNGRAADEESPAPARALSTPAARKIRPTIATPWIELRNQLGAAPGVGGPNGGIDDIAACATVKRAAPANNRNKKPADRIVLMVASYCRAGWPKVAPDSQPCVISTDRDRACLL